MRACNDVDECMLPRFVYVREPLICASEVARKSWGSAHFARPLRCRLEVFRTRSRGWGVRALEPIRRCAIVCVYAGLVIGVHDADAQVDRHALCDAYMFDVRRCGDKGYCIDGFSHRGVGSFINFSCRPNLRASAFCTQSGRQLIAFSAVHDIGVGDELTYRRDTASTPRDAAERDEGDKRKCLCGAPSCCGRF